MLDPSLRVPATNAGWIWQRLRGRFSRRAFPRVAIVFGGTANRGDLALGESLVRSLPGCQLFPYRYPAKERLLRRLGLSGPSIFQGMVLGGGTLINEMGVGPVRKSQAQGIPVWIMGTGAGQGAYEIPEDPDLTEWLPLLQKCRAVGVRGPRSSARLTAIGFTDATVLHDTALVLTPDLLPKGGVPRQWALNVIDPSPYGRPGDWSTTHLEGLIQHLREMHGAGFTFRPFAMLDSDVAPTRAVMRRAGLPEQPVVFPEDSAAIQRHLDECVGGFSMRLHGAVLGTTIGVPMVMLGYMEKCLDFAESLGLQALHVPIREASHDRLAAAIQKSREIAAAGRTDIWQRAHRAQQQIQAFGQSLQRELAAGR